MKKYVRGGQYIASAENDWTITTIKELQSEVIRIAKSQGLDARKHDEEYKGIQIIAWIGLPISSPMIYALYVGIEEGHFEVVIRSNKDWIEFVDYPSTVSQDWLNLQNIMQSLEHYLTCIASLDFNIE